MAITWLRANHQQLGVGLFQNRDDLRIDEFSLPHGKSWLENDAKRISFLGVYGSMDLE